MRKAALSYYSRKETAVVIFTTFALKSRSIQNAADKQARSGAS